MTRQYNERTLTSSASNRFLHSIYCKRNELFPFYCSYFGRSRCCHGVPCLWIHFRYYAKGPNGVTCPLGTPHTQDLFPKQRCVGGQLFINCVIELYPLAVFVGMSKAKTVVGIKYLDIIVHESGFLDYKIIDIPVQNICRIEQRITGFVFSYPTPFRLFPYAFLMSSFPSLPLTRVILTVWRLTTDIWVVPHRSPPNVAFYIFIQQI